MQVSNQVSRAKRARYVTLVGLMSNVFLTGFKYVAGILGSSSAMVADATHSLSDLLTDIIVFLGFRVAAKPADSSHEYGHGKIETLLATLCGIFLLFAGIGICAEGARNLFCYIKGDLISRPRTVALVAAVVSILSKEFLFRYTLGEARKLNSPALAAKAWDHRSDAFSSIGTLVGIGGAIILGPKWRLLDPMAAIMVSGFVIKAAFSILGESLNELIDSSVDDGMKKRILDLIRKDPQVCSVHLMRTRKIGPYFAIEAHIMVNRSMSLVKAHDVSSRLEGEIHDIFGEETLVTLHVEPLPERGAVHRES